MVVAGFRFSVFNSFIEYVRSTVMTTTTLQVCPQM